MDAARLKQSTEFLQSVLDGATYEAVARSHGVTRTAVERPIKTLVLELLQEVGIVGLNPSSAMFVRKLRQQRAAIQGALEQYVPVPPSAKSAGSRVLSDDDIRVSLHRVRSRTATPERDLAMVWILLATGLRPLEVARLVVGDYLREDGNVRVRSEVRSGVAVNGRCRPLYFSSAAACASIDAYLARRVAGMEADGDRNGWPVLPYRGLDPATALFLGAAGRAFHIDAVPSASGMRWLCPEIHYAYRKIFRRIGIPGLSALSMRHTVVDRLLRRGADEVQIAQLLGVREVRAPRRDRLGLHELMEGLV